MEETSPRLEAPHRGGESSGRSSSSWRRLPRVETPHRGGESPGMVWYGNFIDISQITIYKIK